MATRGLAVAAAGPGRVLPRSPTRPLARLRAGDRRAWDELGAGAGRGWQGTQRTEGQSQEGTRGGPTAGTAPVTVTTFVQFLSLRSPDGGRTKAGAWSPELSGVTEPVAGGPQDQDRQWGTAEGLHWMLRAFKKQIFFFKGKG